MEVVVIGGGVAGLETAAALLTVAGPRVRVRVIEPNSQFVYRPMAVAEPFGLGEARRYNLERIATDLGFELVHGTVDWVASSAQRVLLRDGRELAYDALVVALGARPQPAWDHTLTFGGPRDVRTMRALVDEVAEGRTQSVAFVVPRGVTWPLPLYELALMTARTAEEAGREAEIALFTPEAEPLGMLGHEASLDVAEELHAAGVRYRCREPVDVTYDGGVSIPAEEVTVEFDRVVAVPQLKGPGLRGVPHDVYGFIPIDAHGRVRGADHLYAAGDCTDYPIKQGGIATQQADAVADSVAKVAGAGIEPRRFPEVIRAQLLTGTGARFLRGDREPRATHLSKGSGTPLWWPAVKIAGAHLAPYLASLDDRPVGAA